MAGPAPASKPAGGAQRPRLLLIEDSVHYQTLISMLLAQQALASGAAKAKLDELVAFGLSLQPGV